MTISLDNLEIEAECPRCGFYNPFLVKDIAFEKPVICRGCKSLIRPADHMGETQQARRKINKALQDLEQMFKNLGR
ncbi:MAG: hypothetical protein ACLP5H_31360 [Desulfomonilaceae bacterium]